VTGPGGHACPAEPVGDAVALLGEAPYWDAEAGAVLWVDITAGRLHVTAHPSGETVTTELGPPVSAVLPAGGGTRLIARRNRLAMISADGERLIMQVGLPAGVRFNDAGCDPCGRVWIGTMGAPGEAALYRLDAGRVLTQVLAGVTLSNGLGWSPDGTRLYYADTETERVDVFDYDLGTGTASGRRPLADLADAPGRPDGLTVDSDGGVWVAMARGGAVRRYHPDGRLDRVIPLPVSRPTSCAFGGPDLVDLYVTTASERLSDAERAAQPLAGRLLRLRPGRTGIAPVPLANVT
jgi:sugar lactone lactonase YvrE